MHNHPKIIAALITSALVAGNASGSEGRHDHAADNGAMKVEYEIQAGYTSEYIFRGIDLGNDFTEACVNASTGINGWDLSACIWGSAFEGKSLNSRGDSVSNEVNFFGDISRDLGFATASIGYIYYWNVAGTSGALDDQEISFSLSRDLGFATASVTYYWDLINNSPGNDGYTALALSKSWELNQCLSLNLDSTLGYLVEEGQIAHWTNKVSLDWGFVENAKLSPFVALSIEGSAHNDTAWANTENELVAGTMLSVSF